jgi:hypothetical protein
MRWMGGRFLQVNNERGGGKREREREMWSKIN